MNPPVIAHTSKPFMRRKPVWILICVCMLVVAVASINFVRVSVQISLLKSQNAAVRQHAATELGLSKSSRAVEPLIAALKDVNPGVCGSAAIALAQIKDLRAIEPLLAAFKAEQNIGDHELASLEARAVGALGPPALTPLMAVLKDDAYDGEDYDLEDGLVQLGAPAVEPLIAALKDNSVWVRTSAANALGGIRDPRAVDPLIAALKDRYSNVKQAAANALIKIDDPKAVNFLLTALREHNNEVIALASTFYIRRGDPGSEDALIEALEKTSDSAMAADLLTSGNEKLSKAAYKWASSNNYEIHSMPRYVIPGGNGTAWGSSR